MMISLGWLSRHGLATLWRTGWIGFSFVSCFIIGFVYAIAYRCMRVLCTFKQTNT